MNLHKCLIKPCDLETLASDRVVWKATCEAGLAHFVSDWLAASEERRNKTKDRSTVSSLRKNLCLPVWSAESPAYTSTPAQYNSTVVRRRRRPRRTSAAAAAEFYSQNTALIQCACIEKPIVSNLMLEKITID